MTRDDESQPAPHANSSSDTSARWTRHWAAASAADDPALLPAQDGLAADEIRFYAGLAANAGNILLLKYFVGQLGVDPSEFYIVGYTPLSAAAGSGWLQCVTYLLAQGADPEIGTPVRRAAGHGYLEIVKLLVEAGANVNQGSPRDPSALDMAEGAGHDEVASYLRAHGATRRAEVEVEHAPGSLMAHLTETLAPVGRYSYLPIIPIGGDEHTWVHRADGETRTSLVTDGLRSHLWNVPKGEQAYARGELCLHLPADWPKERLLNDLMFCWPMLNLLRLAKRFIDKEEVLGGKLPFIIANSDPVESIGPGTSLTHWLVARTEEPFVRFESDQGTTWIHTMTAIHTDEMKWAKTHGAQALFDELKAQDLLQRIDPQRKSLFKRPWWRG